MRHRLLAALLDGQRRWTSVFGLSLLLHGGALVALARGPRAGAAGTGAITFTLVDAPAAAGAGLPQPAPAPRPDPPPARPLARAPTRNHAPRVVLARAPKPEVAPVEPAAAPDEPTSSDTAASPPTAAATPAGERRAQPPGIMPGSCTDHLDYPASGKEGVVRMLVSLDENGHVVQATVTGAVGFGLDEAALDAVRTRCRFVPARNNRGQPVPSLVEHLFTFRTADFR